MQRREKILSIGFLGILGVSVVGPRVWEAIQGPVRELEAEQTNLAKTVSDAELKFDAALQARRQLKIWKARSLSPNPQQAAVFYQQWLTDSAELIAGLQNVSVIPERMLTAAGRTHVGVRMKLTAEGNFDQIRTFLYNYYRIDLLHRLVQLHILKQEDQPGLLTLNLTTEGLSLPDAPSRGAQLFPRLELPERLEASSTSVTVHSSEAFPEDIPFRIRLGPEYARVTEVKFANKTQTWKLTRGVDGTPAENHPAGTTLELAPVHPDFPEKLVELDRVLKANPFLREQPPQPYQPKLNIEGTTRIGTGETLEMKFTISNFDPQKGKVDFSFSSDLPGNPMLTPTGENTATLSWAPPAEQTPATFSGTVSVMQRDGESETWKENQELKITFNNLPELAPVTVSPLTPGDTLELKLTATDADLPQDELTFSAENLPETAALDSTTGMLTWKIPGEASEATHQVSVSVSDKLGGQSEQSLTLRIGEDIARQTFLTFTGEGFTGKPQAWLRNKSTQETVRLSQGEKLTVADIDATLEQVNEDHIVIKRQESLWKINLGQHLRTMTKLPEAQQPKLKENESPEEPATEAADP